MVLVEGRVGTADGAEGPRLKIELAGDVVDDLIGEGVEKEAVDGEVAALGVFLGGGELHFGGTAAVEVFAVGAERGDFDDALADVDEDDAEGLADGLSVAEEAPDF